MNWIIAVILIIVVGVLLDREIYFYEGTHLGPRLQAWLYDRWSKKYDEGKRTSQLQDDEMLARPLLHALRDVPDPLILDFATGTGRLSFALLNRAGFKGRILALDLSLGMLEKAAQKLNRHTTSIEFLRHISLPLPFPDAAFDAVCALEVLELFPGMEGPLAELTRVLRPGGVLLTSRGTEESGRKARIKSARALTVLLEQYGLGQVQITRWWSLFDRVLAIKRGTSQPVPSKSLSEILKCSSCKSIVWSVGSGGWTCQACGTGLSITKEGIVLDVVYERMPVNLRGAGFHSN